VRFEVRYPAAPAHEVELQGTIAVLGRDPSCDLVLNDAKCSRRHAVIEAGPQGIAIRDAGSANGVFVNGKRVERASLSEGDIVRLGGVLLKVLPEDMPGTLVMGPEEMPQGAGPTPDAPPGSPQPLEGAPPPARVKPPLPPSQPPRAETVRPRQQGTLPVAAVPATSKGSLLTAKVLSILWLLSVLPAFGLSLWVLRLDLAGWQTALALSSLAALVVLSLLMAYGLWMQRAWARILQILVAIPSLIVCPLTLTAGAILLYMWHPGVRSRFHGQRPEGPEPAEMAFTGAILGSLLIGIVVTTLGSLFLPARSQSLGVSEESRAVEQIRALVAAENSFRAGTCNLGYADLRGLLEPTSAIPNYPTAGPKFLTEERAPGLPGYRFELSVEELLPPVEGCSMRSFRAYSYTATPVGKGRYFLVREDGIVHAASDHPATPDDPTLP